MYLIGLRLLLKSRLILYIRRDGIDVGPIDLMMALQYLKISSLSRA